MNHAPPNVILCADCFGAEPREEKTCTHGYMVGIVCSQCGRTRTDKGEPPWHCIGSGRAKLVEVENSVDTRRRRTVRVDVPLVRPVFAKTLSVTVQSYSSNGGPWTPPTIGLHTGGGDGISVDDWPAVRAGVELALESFRKVVSDAEATVPAGTVELVP